MEQRIKIIWLLSVFSILLIVAGQGYWLWNQCRYNNEKHTDAVFQQVLYAAAQNDSVRSLQPRRYFGRQRRITESSHLSSKFNLESPSKNRFIYLFKCQTRDKADSSDVYCDTIRFGSHKDLGEYVPLFLYRYKLEVDVPFTTQRFDSLLAATLGYASFGTSLGVRHDTLLHCRDTVELIGTSLYPHYRVTYYYNPVKQQFVQVDVRPPLSSLLLRMAWQLFGSLLMIFLLAVCLVIQIKTILKQRRIDELRKSFVNTMIHELKRPVQALKMCVAFLNNKTMRTDEQAMDEVVRDSISELDNLSAYLQKLRDMIRADDKQTQLSLSTFDLKPVVEKLIRLQHSHEDKQISFETHLADNLLVTADPVHIANIISNLIENAIKYSGTSVHICVECALHHHQLTLKVSDNGIGISTSDQGHVFDKFYRGSNLPDHFIPGIGLGLSYVKLLVDAHRGSISLSSQLGRGTTVEINIPQ